MSILPIIVLFKRNLEDSESINSLLNSNDKNEIKELFVYNNSPEVVDVPDSYRGIPVHFINDYKNSGVSKAYNEGIKYAKSMHYTYVLLLDQDTTLPEKTLNTYIKYARENKTINLFCPVLKTSSGAICSPLRYKLHRGFPVKEITEGEYPLNDFSPINSGMLINVDAAIECGGYNEDVFLDFSDFQFIERFKTANNRFYVIPLILEQDFSGDETDTNKLLIRFAIYCRCAKRCVRENINDDAVYFFMVLARAMKLIIKTKSFAFIFSFYKNYIRG